MPTIAWQFTFPQNYQPLQQMHKLLPLLARRIVNFSSSKDYYTMLKVLPSASQEEIKQSYIKLAKQYHPDSNPNASTSAFLEINEAYKVLLDDQTRRIYDQARQMKIVSDQKGDQQMWKQYDNMTAQEKESLQRMRKLLPRLGLGVVFAGVTIFWWRRRGIVSKYKTVDCQTQTQNIAQVNE